MHVSLQSYDKQRLKKEARRTNARVSSGKTSVSEAQVLQDKPIPEHRPVHCPLCYTYTLSKHLMSSQASALAKHHVSFHQAAFRKTPRVCSQLNLLPRVCFNKTSSHMSASAKRSLTRQFPEKHHMTQLGLQQNRNFTLHRSLQYLAPTRESKEEDPDLQIKTQ